MKIVRVDGKEFSCINEKHAIKKIRADIYLQNTMLKSEKRYMKKDYKIVY